MQSTVQICFDGSLLSTPQIHNGLWKFISIERLRISSLNMFFPAANNREGVRRWQAGRIFQDPVFPFTCEKNLFSGHILEGHTCQLVQCMLATPFILPFYAPQLLSFSFFSFRFPLCTKNILYNGRKYHILVYYNHIESGIFLIFI
jgi:hypothetical protein